MSVRQLPTLLRDDPALLAVRGRSTALIAVPEPARAFTLAGLVATTQRRPYVVAVPTTADAERCLREGKLYPRFARSFSFCAMMLSRAVFQSSSLQSRSW